MGRVAYKPLGTSPSDCDGDEQQLETECEIEEPFPRMANNHCQYKNQGIFSASFLGLRQLRVLLYIVAILLFLLFVAQLSTNGSKQDVNNNIASNITTHPRRKIQDRSEATAILQQTKELENHDLEESNVPTLDSKLHSIYDNRRPLYDSYLSSELRNSQSRAVSTLMEPFDDFHFPIDDQQHSSSGLHGTTHAWWILNSRQLDKYVTVSNYIRAMKSFSYNNSITLTTQATIEFIYHSLELCKRWDGPISIAVFGPGTEMLVATTLIKFMRQCLPGPLSACIRDKITWHLVYNKAHGPPASNISYPRFNLDSKNYPLFVDQDLCPKLAGPEPSDLIRQFEGELKKANKIYPNSYRQQFKLPYPINVLRNTARLSANTKYVLASDIELYPSVNLVPLFANYINRHDVKKEYNYVKKHIFTLPIFEVKSNVTAPKTKSDLVKLIENNDAIFFHKWVCDICQNFPNRLDWLQTDKVDRQDYNSNGDEIVIFETTQRNKSRDSWEPIFIGTNDDPLYDDRLTWDGRRDKMAQMYEMCLQDYYLLVLGNAFLVHAPGIKHIDKNDNFKRLKYIRENNAIYDATMSQLRQKYSGSRNINKC